jgi:hypothetical protein
MNNIISSWKDTAADAFNQRKVATGRPPQSAVSNASAAPKEKVQVPTSTTTPANATPEEPQSRADIAPCEQPMTLQPLPVDPALTTKQAAPILNESFETLKKWRQKGVGPAYIRYESGAIRYRLSALMQYLNERTVKPRSKPRRGKA